MSIDRSLKIKSALSRHRNVLSRAERIEKLKEDNLWEQGDKVTGLPKVGHRKASAGKKSPTEEKKTDAAAAADGKAAAPAKAAPAAKAAAKK